MVGDSVSMDPALCKADFRVEKNDLNMLKEALDIPDKIICHQRLICDGMEGLCIVLKRLAYPCRYSDMIPLFARPVPVLSMITNSVIDDIYDSHHHRTTGWNQTLLNPLKLESYAEVIQNNGGALDNCFGFIDGTVRPICRPGENQRILYNGHKRVHAIKSRSVTLPNGMIAQLFGPVGKSNYNIFFFVIIKYHDNSHSFLSHSFNGFVNIYILFLMFVMQVV